MAKLEDTAMKTQADELGDELSLIDLKIFIRRIFFILLGASLTASPGFNYCVCIACAMGSQRLDSD